MEIHPFLINNDTPFQVLPSQNIPLNKKDKKWREACMDALENYARIQFEQKQRLLKNYAMVNGELVASDYAPETEDDLAKNDLLGYTAETEGKRYEKHYDIISQPLSTLTGEMDAFPDVFNVIGRGDMIQSERDKMKMSLLREWFEAEQARHIAEAQGERTSPDDELFNDRQVPEEQPTPMTPPEIQKYMTNEFRHLIEVWGQYELEDQFERFNIKGLRREEFYHYLVAGERFRFIKIDGKGMKVISTNPLFTAVQKAPTDKYSQYGNFATYVELQHVPAIIDEFGYLMTDDQINSLEAPFKEHSKKKDKGLGTDINGRPVDYSSPLGIPYQTRVPTLNPYINNWIPQMANMTSAPGYYFTDIEMSKVNGWGNDYMSSRYGLLVVVRGFWKSQIRKGKLTWINPVTNLYEVREIDENFVVPEYITEIKDELYNYVGELNTIVWTRETQIWEGVKITNFGTTGFLKEPMYLGIKPSNVQVGRLPICGQFSRNINTKPTSFVDGIKNLQYFYNVLMNEAFHFIVTEWLPFLVVDQRDIPNDKDWGGEDGLQKWSEVGQAGGIAPLDVSPENRQGSSGGGQYPREINLERSTRIMTRLQMAAAIRQLALEQVGITMQRMGNVKATETATGIQQATTSSYTQTSSWFSEFFECEKDILQYQLDAAKFLQATDGDFNAQSVKSDLSIQTLKFSLEDGNLYDLHVYVTDSQEELRRLQTAQRLALENNTSDMMMSDRLEMSTNPSYRDILDKLKDSEKITIQQQQQALQAQQQQLQQAGMEAQAAREQAERQFNIEQQVKIHIATLQALGRQRDGDMNRDGQSDILEYNKSITELQNLANQFALGNSKLDIERERNEMDASYKDKELRDRHEQRRHEMAMQKIDVQRDKIREAGKSK